MSRRFLGTVYIIYIREIDIPKFGAMVYAYREKCVERNRKLREGWRRDEREAYPAGLILEVASLVSDTVLVVTAVEKLDLSHNVRPLLGGPRRKRGGGEGGRSKET